MYDGGAVFADTSDSSKLLLGFEKVLLHRMGRGAEFRGKRNTPDETSGNLLVPGVQVYIYRFDTRHMFSKATRFVFG